MFRYMPSIAPGGVFLALFAVVPVLAQPTAETQVPEGYQIVLGDRWSFAVPAEWQNAPAPSSNLGEVRIVAQLSDAQQQTVVTLVTEPYTGRNEDYIDQNLQTLTRLGYTVHDQRSIAIGELQGTELEVGVPSEPPVRLVQRLVADNGLGFAMTCGSAEANFESNQAICDTILDSFRVLP